jgi:glycosyltransferase involved in cell wall biosynthesis
LAVRPGCWPNEMTLHRTRATDVLLVGDGASRHIERLAEALAGAGVQTAIACFEATATIPHVRYIMLGNRAVDAHSRYAFAIPRLARALSALRPAILHAHYLSSYGVMAAAARRLAAPFGSRPILIQTVWGTDLLVTAGEAKWRDGLARFALREADAVTGDSDDLEFEARARAPRLRWHTFIFGPPENLFTAQFTQKKPQILSHRRLVPEMRVPLIADAFLRAHDRGSQLAPYRLVVAGDGPDAKSLEDRLDGGRIQLLGHLSMTDLHRLLIESSVVVSIPRSDGTSASLLEGMAAGLVPVVNALPANLEWVSPETGIIVSRDPSADELATALIRAVERPPQRARIREVVRPAAWELQTRELLKLYSALAGRQIPNG